MKILFFSTFYPNPLSGGVERVTHNLCSILSEKYGHPCYVMYYDVKCAREESATNFIKLSNTNSARQIREFISQNGIQVVIIQGNIEAAKIFRNALPAEGNCKLVYVFHGEPLYPYKTWTIEYILDLMRYRHLYRYGLQRLSHFPIRRLHLRQELLTRYKQLADMDWYVFLSKNYILPYVRFTGHSISDKATAIPNPLSFAMEENIANAKKEKRILIVARFEEHSKRLLHALRIWRILKNHKEMSGWSLDIVGDGIDKDLLIEYLHKHPLSDVNFYGVQDPLPFYQRSSIFMLTSYSECFPLTLLEAMQFGCVPIAFNSFASASDIISHGKDGFIVRYRKLHQYAKSVLKLCNDDQYRFEIANNAIRKAQSFSIENVAQMWNNILNETISKN